MQNQNPGDVVSGLVTATIVNLLPIENKSIVTLIAFQAGQLISPALREIAALPTRWFGRLFKRTLVLESKSSIYQSFEEYLIRNYLVNLQQCRLAPRKGDVNFDLRNAILSTPIKIPWKGYELEVGIGQPATSSGGKSSAVGNGYDITLSSKAPLEVMKEFVVSICETRDRANTQTLQIYRNVGGKPKRGKNKDEEATPVSWEKLEVFTNRNLANTILDRAVEQELLADIKEFISAREWHNSKGIPFKRGFLLSGPPGTGKTSIVKAIAVEYNLPIFSLDLSTVNSNTELTQLMAEICYLAKGQIHILSMEDVDRLDLFAHYRHGNSEVTTDCLLNVMDGVVESHGRLTFLSANNTSPLQEVPALLRPGRIDKTVKIDFVKDEQLQRIIGNFYDSQDLPGLSEIHAPAELSPAQVINTLRTRRDDPVAGLALFQQGQIEQVISEEKMLTTPSTIRGRYGAVRSKRQIRAARKKPMQRIRQLTTEQTKLNKRIATIERQKATLQEKVESENEKKRKTVERMLGAGKKLASSSASRPQQAAKRLRVRK